MPVTRDTNKYLLKKDLEELNKIYDSIKQTDTYRFLMKGYIPSLSYSYEQIASYLPKDQYEELLKLIAEDHASLKECYGIVNLFFDSVTGSINIIEKAISQHYAIENMGTKNHLLDYKDSFMKASYECVVSLINKCEANISKIERPIKDIIRKKEEEYKRMESERLEKQRTATCKKETLYQISMLQKKMHVLANKYREQQSSLEPPSFPHP